MQYQKLLIVYILVAGAAAFALCGADKRRARLSRRRISEAALLTAGLAGGCFGLWAGMYFFRHKTLHLKFVLLVPLECLIWGALVAAAGFLA